MHLRNFSEHTCELLLRKLIRAYFNRRKHVVVGKDLAHLILRNMLINIFKLKISCLCSKKKQMLFVDRGSKKDVGMEEMEERKMEMGRVV